MIKACLLSVVFSLTSLFSYSQVFVGDVNINQDENIKIIEVLVAARLSAKSINIFVDFGQKSNYRSGSLNNKSKDQRITDPKTQEEKLFVSSSALLNYMESNGWEHYNSLFVNDSGGLFYYYFKRKIQP